MWTALASEKSRRASAKLRKNMGEIMRQPEELSAMLTVVDTLGTKECAVPEAAVARAGEMLCQAYDVTLDEDIGRGLSGDVRSRYFNNLWETLRMEAEDPEGTNVSESVIEWMRSGAPIGWRKELKTCGVFPATTEDTAAVEKSKQFDLETLGAPFDNYRSFYDAGEHADSEMKRIHEAGSTEVYQSLAQGRAGP